ncbi:hypothetical protein SS50377_26619 [Spironucleus salmonicida]|uniref:Uncharacterized protein n=1 Tax=Spironucleus salmonicida TaxID=348837 RepID=V6LCR3_9EUKA|nr:hypothetical protein SS50377_26619 [Spironucleus salmonicida]|eukprot:EST41466.1 Hypothetical protein SS50377_19189 [Spironucleus salmonicida]
MDYSSLLQALTPVLDVIPHSAYPHSAPISSFFKFLDRPQGHLALINNQPLFFIPNLIYLKIEAPFGIVELDCPPYLDTIIDQLTYLIQLYPNLQNLQLSEIKDTSFATIKWTCLNISPNDKFNNEIYSYYNLSYESLKIQIENLIFKEPIPRQKTLFMEKHISGARMSPPTFLNFDIKRPQTDPVYFETNTTFVTVKQLLKVSAALRNAPLSISDLNSTFKFICNFLGLEGQNEIDLDLSQEDLSPQMQLLFNALYIRFARSQAQSFYKGKLSNKRILIVKPYVNGKKNIFFQDWQFASQITKDDIKKAIFDIANVIFNTKNANQNLLFEIISQKRQFDCKILRYEYGEIVSFQHNNEKDVIQKLFQLLESCVADVVNQAQVSKSKQPERKNQFYIAQKSLSHKSDTCQQVLVRKLDYFKSDEEVEDLLNDIDIELDLFNLHDTCKVISQSKGYNVNQIRLETIGMFITETEDFNQQKDNIREKLGKLWGYDVELKVEIRVPPPSQVKKFTLKAKE